MRRLNMFTVPGAFILTLSSAIAQDAPPPAPEPLTAADLADQARTGDLNRGIRQHNDAIATANAKAAADYAAERARYEAALAVNDQERAKAAQAARDYAAARAAYETELARIAAGAKPAVKRDAAVVRRVANTADNAAPERMQCKTFTVTGSLTKTYRTCKPVKEWSRERDNIRAPGGAGGACQQVDC